MGVYPDVPLAQAREKRDAARKLLAQDIDPAQKRLEDKKVQADTFEAVGRSWLAALSSIRHGIGLGKVTHNVVADTVGVIDAPIVTHHASINEPRQIGEMLRAIDRYTGRRITIIAVKLNYLCFPRPIELRTAESTPTSLWLLAAFRSARQLSEETPQKIIYGVFSTS